MFLRPSARASPKNSIVASSRLTAFFFALLFLGAFGAFFPLWGVFDLAFSALFQRPRFFFSWFFCSPRGFCGPQTSLIKKEKTPLTKHTIWKVSFLFLLCFFSFVCRKRFILPDLFLKEEKNLIIVKHSFAFFLTRQIKQARKARKKRPCCCFASSVLSPPHKKDIIPIRVKSPTTPCWRPQRERTRRQQTTTTTTTDDALWRKERRHFWTTTTTTTTEQQK